MPPTTKPKSNKRLSSSTIRVADLCCGLGGLSLAAQDLGMHVSAGVDVNASALKTFAKNFPNARPILGSVRSSKVLGLCEEALFDNRPSGLATAIVSGPPCQGFSVAGTRDPMDPRNQVLNAVARAIVRIQPDFALIENVSMVLGDQHDDRIKRFEGALSDGEYHVTHVLLDAAEFGVCQRRKRAFFLATKAPLDREQFLVSLNKHKRPARNVEDALRGLPVALERPERYSDEEDYGMLPNHFAMRHSQRVKEKIAAIAPGKGPMSYRRLHPARLSNTLISGHRAPPAHYAEARSITVREAARLQSFPDSFRIYGSFGNQMEQVTNAVPPLLARAVLSTLVASTNL